VGNYVLTRKALEDLGAIWRYTRDNWSESQADEYYRALITACEGLAQRKWPASAYHHVLPGLKGLRVKSHILFFIERRDSGMLVIRILHQRMDLRSRLFEGR
jgi:toxin ParE1/3/4